MTQTGLQKMAQEFPTDFWNDSCSISEINYALEHGAVGATTNPVIVKNVVVNEFATYQPIIQNFIKENPTSTEDEIAWQLIEYTAVEGAKLLEDIFHENNGKKGRISIQTNTKYYRNAELMAQQAVHFSTLAPNIHVKMPVTKAGVQAVELATYHGVSINATVSYSVAQAVAVAEAVERGLKRRRAENKDTSTMHPVCTIMIGRVDDWLKKQEVSAIDPKALEYGGIAVMKKAYQIFKERGYETGLLGAAYRNEHQWLDLVGGELELTIPHGWIKKFNEGTYSVENRIDVPVSEDYLADLLTLEEFRKMYDEHGMKEEDFLFLGATQHTLKQFFEGYDELIAIIRKEQSQIG